MEAGIVKLRELGNIEEMISVHEVGGGEKGISSRMFNPQSKLTNPPFYLFYLALVLFSLGDSQTKR